MPASDSVTAPAIRKLTQRQTDALARAVVTQAPVLRFAPKALGMNNEGQAAQGEDLIAEWAPLKRGLTYRQGEGVVVFSVRAGHWTVQVAFDPEFSKAEAIGIRDSKTPAVG